MRLAKSEDMQIIRDLVDSLEDRRSILDQLEQLRDGCEFLNLRVTSCFGVNFACFFNRSHLFNLVVLCRQCICGSFPEATSGFGLCGEGMSNRSII